MTGDKFFRMKSRVLPTPAFFLIANNDNKFSEDIFRSLECNFKNIYDSFISKIEIVK